MNEEKILVADDEDIIQSVVGRTLAYPPYRVVSTKRGDEVVALALQERPDLILLDVHMPQRDGREVLKELRRNLHTQMIPVILLTGRGGMEDKVAGFDLGADDYITKPFEAGELRARVGGLLRRNRRDTYCNPLTRLPGNPAIEDNLAGRLRAKLPFAFFYMDIDHFKPFNDSYGFAMGDFVIQQTAGLLREAVLELGTPEDFIGHVGGDDFVLIAGTSRAEELARRMAEGFDAAAPAYYNAEDRARGFIVSKDRQGSERRFPLLSLTVGVTTTERRSFSHVAQVIDAACEVKRFLKGRPDRKGSAFLFDRRADPGR